MLDTPLSTFTIQEWGTCRPQQILTCTCRRDAAKFSASMARAFYFRICILGPSYLGASLLATELILWAADVVLHQ